MAFPDGWHYYAPLVIQNGQVGAGGPFSDVPVYLDETCLPSDMITSGGSTASLASGADIRFTSDVGGANQLPFHLVEYTQNAVPASASANIWVLVPSVSSVADTTIYIWWGNPSASALAVDDTYGQYATWANYNGRFMLDDDTEAGGGTKLTDINVTYGAGVIDNCIQFNADASEFVNAFFSVPTTALATSFWVNVDSTRVNGDTIATIGPYRIYVNASSAGKFKLQFRADWSSTDGVWISTSEYDVDTWYHVHLYYNVSGGTGIDPVFYIDGTQDVAVESSTPAGSIGSASTVYFGSNTSYANRFRGEVDEWFVDDATESGGLALTLFNNQNSPSTFVVEGSTVTIVSMRLGISSAIRAYQDVDPLVSYDILPSISSVVLPAFSIQEYVQAKISSSNSIRAYQRHLQITSNEISHKIGYRITAVDTTTEVETELGFIAYDSSPLELTGVTIADGTYDLRVYLQGYRWKDARLIDAVRITVSGGAVSDALPPPIENLNYDQIDEYTRFIWTWSQTFGCLTPAEFGLWVSTIGAPSIAGAPTLTVEAEIPRNYEITHHQQSDTIWIAVAAIHAGGTRGPESRLGPLAPVTALSSPSTQFAEESSLLSSE